MLPLKFFQREMYCTTSYILFNFFSIFCYHTAEHVGIGTYESLSSKSHVWANHILATVGTQWPRVPSTKGRGRASFLPLDPFLGCLWRPFQTLHISISRRLGNQSQQGLQGVCHRQNSSRPGLICPHGHLLPHSQSQETRTKGKPPGLRKPRLWQTHSLDSTSQLLTVRVESCTETSRGMQEIASPTSSTFFLNV